MRRINANAKIWDIVDRCREGKIKYFGDFYGKALKSVSSEVTSVYSERYGNKYINGTVEFGDISVTYNIGYGTFKVDGIATFDNEFVKFAKEVLVKVFGK